MFPRISVTIGLLLFLMLAVVACGGDNDDDDLASIQDQNDSPAVEPDSDGPVDEADPTVDMDAEVAEESDAGAAQISTEGFDRRVIRSAELELHVTDVRASVRHARELAVEYGGRVDSSSARTLADDGEIADLTLEVPSPEFDSVLDGLRDGRYVERVEHESTSSRDVTEEYVDLQSRLSNLESTEARFVALLDEADSIDDILNVEREISRIRGEIEQIHGRINYLEQRTDYSRIHVQFHPLDDEEEEVVANAQYFTPGETAREAWNASMQFVGTFGNAIIAVGVFFWWAWPLLVIALIGFLQYRRRSKDVVTT